MARQAIEDAVRRLAAANLASEGALQGCGEEEVHALERTYEVRLPAAYRDFLKRMGRGAGEFLTGTEPIAFFLSSAPLPGRTARVFSRAFPVPARNSP
jgi:hypothetical protein